MILSLDTWRNAKFRDIRGTSNFNVSSVKTLTLVSSIYIFDIGCIYIVNLLSSKHKVVQSTKSRVLFVINVEQMFNYFLVVTLSYLISFFIEWKKLYCLFL